MLIWFVYPPETGLTTVTASYQVYHYLIECLLKYSTLIVIQMRKSSQESQRHWLHLFTSAVSFYWMIMFMFPHFEFRSLRFL